MVTSSEDPLHQNKTNDSIFILENYQWCQSVSTVILDCLMRKIFIKPNAGQNINNGFFKQISPTNQRHASTFFEPLHEKTCLRGFRSGKTQTGLLS